MIRSSPAVFAFLLLPTVPAFAAKPRSSGAVPRSRTYVLRFEARSRTSCSRSSAASTRKGTLSLKLRWNRAELKMRVDESSSFGPSRGAYRRGARGFSYRQERRRFVWRGSLKRQKGGGVKLNLSFRTSRCTVPARPGIRTAVVLRCPRIPSVHLECKMGTVQAYGKEPANWTASVAKKGEKTRPVRAVLCSAVGSLPEVLEPAETGTTIPFKSKPRLRLFKSSWRWRGTWAILRSP